MDAEDMMLQGFEDEDPFDMNYVPPPPPPFRVYNFKGYNTNFPFQANTLLQTEADKQNEIFRLNQQLQQYRNNPLGIVYPMNTIPEIMATIKDIQENRPIPSTLIMTGDGLKKATRWTDFVRKYAKENKIPYGCALSKASEEYKKHKGIVKNIKTSIGRKEEYAKRYLKSTVGEGFGDFFKKTLPSGLIHQGIPILGTVAGTALGSIAGPVSSVMGSQIGAQAGEALADDIGRKTGYGIRNRVLRKGSSIVRR